MSVRLDVFMSENGLIPSREKAKALIIQGNVCVNGKPCIKPSKLIEAEDIVEIKGNQLAFVSRGGLKLDKALRAFGLQLHGKICADIGASTGGFTDCMLQNGAAKVYAIDVGKDQLNEKLKTDPRVINLEQTNFRYLTKENVKDFFDFATVDVSFISLSLIFPVLYNLLNEEAEAVCLIKPQFEAGKGLVGKKGVVKDISVHKQVVKQVMNYAISCGFCVLGLEYSPIKGPEGNIEYLLHFKKSYDIINMIDNEYAESIVLTSHKSFKKPDNKKE